MQTVERHGGGSHYVRPDRVYRTGVLTSTMGYDPGVDVQNVASAFTAYPMDLQAPGLAGLGANNIGWLQRMRLRFRAWKARHGFQGGWNYGQGMGDFTPNAFAPGRGIAYPQVGAQIDPVQVAKADMASLLMAGNMDEAYARAQAGTTWNKWWNQRWNG